MNSGFSVRVATEADLGRVSEIKVRNWAETYGPLLEPAVLRPFLDRPTQLRELREEVARPGTLLLVAEDTRGEVARFLERIALMPSPPASVETRKRTSGSSRKRC